MCRHCERIKEHPEDRDIVHAFMERTARRFTERAREKAAADPSQQDVELSSINIKADDLDVSVTANFTQWRGSSLGDAPLLIPGRHGEFESARSRVLRMLDQMHK